MNPLIVTIIIALGTFIISIFGASWLNQQAINKRIDDLKMYLDARFAGLEQSVKARFDAVDARFDAVDTRFDAVDQRFSGWTSESSASSGNWIWFLSPLCLELD